MTLQMPEADGAVLARREKIVAALRQIVPGEGVIAGEREMRPFETDGLTAYHQLPMVVVLPETAEQVAPGAALLLRRGHPGGAARRRHLAVGRRAAAGRRRAARHGQVQPHPRDRLRQPPRGGRARRHQSRHLQRRCRRRLLLRARSVLADRLHHRRQYRGEFRRRALPEIRHDRQQRARLRDRADHRRGAAHRRQASRCRRLRPARHHHRLGRPARRRHRSHGAHPAQAGDGARAADRLSRRRRTPANASQRSSAPASSPAAWR